jgi:hypothetical protein
MCCDGDDQRVLERVHCSALAYLVASFRSTDANRAGLLQYSLQLQ